jgi:DtxR family transcriptional regulator, Mn-dependent transcriptional regulator
VLPFDDEQGKRVLEALYEQGVLVSTEGNLELTAHGYERALVTVRRHRLTERLLLDVIGLDWWKVHHEAERWEGVVSQEVETHLVDLLGDPGVCPHGNPIPGSANRPDQSGAVTLDAAPIGPVRVVRITETLEADDEALQLLEGCGFIPGRDGEIKHRQDGWVEVAGSVRDAALPPHIATHTFVLPT